MCGTVELDTWFYGQYRLNQAFSNVVSLFIVGHTDNAGTLEANLKLSEDRAKAVTSMLTSKFNVSPTQIMAKGVGSLAPIANNGSEDGRRLNRRVEMVKQ